MLKIKLTVLSQTRPENPFIGVNVVEKGTTNGVITDFNGQFTLNVAQGKTLVFSYVGYTTQEITVKGSSLKIIMEEDSKTLDEVVVVGYGSRYES